jgi:predicted nucleic acid-binding protein
MTVEAFFDSNVLVYAAVGAGMTVVKKASRPLSVP